MSAEHERGAERVGLTIRGKYTLDRVLGVGGMAVVYEATHRNRKRFAVKMLHPELSLHKDVSTRFLREGYVANTVDHPGAVAVVDDDVADDGSAFLVMELLEGAGLETLWLRAGRQLPDDAALACAEQLLDVLIAAHSKGIVHRDLKPANLFITKGGQLKVLDFGIARLREVAAPKVADQQTRTGVFMGTPAFVPPEQATGRTREIDGQTDLWAVGATVFTLLTGQYVHPATHDVQMVMMAATEHARSLATLKPGASPWLVAWVDRALMFAKSDRWANASVMLAELRQHLGTSRTSQSILAALVTGAKPVAPAVPLDAGGATVLPDSSTQPEEAAAQMARPVSLPPKPHAGSSQPDTASPEAQRVLLPREADAPALMARGPAAKAPAPGAKARVPAVKAGAPAAKARAHGTKARSSEGEPPAPSTAGWSSRIRWTTIIESLLAGVAWVALVVVGPWAWTSYRNPPPAEIPAGERTRVAISASPPDARVFIDESLCDGNPCMGVFPRDGRTHRVRAQASDYMAQVAEVAFDREDVSVTLTLRKR